MYSTYIHVGKSSLSDPAGPKGPLFGEIDHYITRYFYIDSTFSFLVVL